MHGTKWLTPIAITAVFLTGCSDDSASDTVNGKGGTSSQGGKSSEATGGSAVAQGGSSGSAVGGATSTAGSQAVAGSTAASGSTGVAGGLGVGGEAVTIGGTSNLAGATNLAGNPAAAAGATEAGGAATGGAATGGAATGGTTNAATAGAHSGGAATGGLTNRVNAACGNGVVDVGEDCDDGNAREDDGCTTSCRYGCYTVKDCDDKNPCTADSCGPTQRGFACAYETLAGTKCDDGDACTKTDACDSTAACRGADNICACKTNADCVAREDGNACNGTLRCVAGQCEINPATIISCNTSGDTDCRKSVCNPATGVCSFVDTTEGAPCDDGLFCTSTDTCKNGTCVGTGDPCQGFACGLGCDETNRRCAPKTAQTNCRGSGGTCDPAESCDGIGFDCPVDARAPIGTVCRASSGDCDIAETCNGVAAACPDDAVKATGTVCRAMSGDCDVAESCDGSSRECPSNQLAANGSVCRAKAGDCDIAEICSGADADCPADGFATSSTLCRNAVGPCDVSEYCSGSGSSCPVDTVAASGTVCRPSATACDVTEHCDGLAATCPNDAFMAAGTPCNDGQACTVQDRCNTAGQCSVSVPQTPSMPKLLWPTNGWLTGSATAAALGSLSLRPQLRWEAASPDGCGAVTYEVQLDDSCNLATLSSCKFASPEVTVAGVTATSYRPDSNLATRTLVPMGTAYAWRVRACRSGVCSGWTAPRYLVAGRAPNDFNGDGYSDLAIGAPEAGNDGRVYVYYGTALGIVSTAVTTVVPPTAQTGQAFGSATAVGDLDGDGYADLAIGAPLWDDDTSADVGKVLVYRGGAAGLEATPSYTIDALTPEVGAKFGFGLALEGDINADGLDDLAIGEPLRDTAQADEGIVSVHFGHAATVPDLENFVVATPYPTAGANYGSVLTLGDVNGDGASDLVVGAPGSRRGAIVFLGATGVIPIPAPIDLGTGGNAVAANGDTDGSGRINLMFGMNNNMWHGWLCDGSYFYTYDGGATNITGTGNPSRGCNYGYALGNGGDLDGDGLFDSVGASVYEGPGMVVLFHGTQSAGITGWYEIWNPANVSGGQFGYAIGTRGDFDADGMADLVISAPEQNTVYVFQGKSTGPAVEPSVTLNGTGKFGRAMPR